MLTGKPDAGNPPVRFGGRGGELYPRSYPDRGIGLPPRRLYDQPMIQTIQNDGMSDVRRINCTYHVGMKHPTSKASSSSVSIRVIRG